MLYKKICFLLLSLLFFNANVQPVQANSYGLLGLLLSAGGSYGLHSEYSCAKKRIRKSENSKKKSASWIRELCPFRSGVYGLTTLIGMILISKKISTHPTEQTPNSHPAPNDQPDDNPENKPVNQPPIKPINEPPISEPINKPISSSQIIDPHNPKVKPLQFTHPLSKSSQELLFIQPAISDYLRIFEGVTPGWNINTNKSKAGLEEAKILKESFLNQREKYSENYSLLQQKDKNDLFKWTYRQYWNTNREALIQFLQKLKGESAIKQSCPSFYICIYDFIEYLHNDLYFINEPIEKQNFHDCANQNVSSDCGTYALQTAILLATNQEEKLLNKGLYTDSNQRIRKIILENIKKGNAHLTEEKKKRILNGNLDDEEIRSQIPLNLTNVFVVSINDLQLIAQEKESDLISKVEEIYVRNQPVIIIANTHNHWITLELSKTFSGKMNVRAFDSTTSIEKESYKNGLTNATNIATTISYAFTEYV